MNFQDIVARIQILTLEAIEKFLAEQQNVSYLHMLTDYGITYDRNGILTAVYRSLHKFDYKSNQDSMDSLVEKLKASVFGSKQEIQERVSLSPDLYKYLLEPLSHYFAVNKDKPVLDNEAFIDPISMQVMEYPVCVNGRRYDIKTIMQLAVDEFGFRTDPFSREKFTLRDVLPAINLRKNIANKLLEIEEPNLQQFEILKELCILNNGKALKVKLESLSDFDINYFDQHGMSLLHYACQIKADEVIPVLLNHNAKLDLESKDQSMVTPYKLLDTYDQQYAYKILQLLLTMLEERSQQEDVEAKLYLGKIYLESKIMPMDSGKVLNYFLDMFNQYADARGIFYIAKFLYSLYMCNKSERCLTNAKKYCNIIDVEKLPEAKLYINMISYWESYNREWQNPDLELITKYAEQNHPDALYVLAHILKSGVYVEQDKIKSDLLLYQAYKLNNPCAIYDYATDVLENNGGEYVDELVTFSYRLAARLGHPLAAEQYGDYAAAGKRGVEVNMGLACRYWSIALAHNIPSVMYKMALCFSSGVGVAADKALSQELMAKAAELKYPQAMFAYGQSLIAQNIDYQQGKKYLMLAAKGGNLEAQEAICIDYTNTQNVTDLYELLVFSHNIISINSEFGKKLFSSLLLQIEGADYNSNYKKIIAKGDLYWDGKFVAKEPYLAAKYYRFLAEHGVTARNTILGDIYYLGMGVPQDFATALKYYKQKADHSKHTESTDGDVNYNLVYMYSCGQGTVSSNKLAKKYVSKITNSNLKDKAIQLIAYKQNGSNYDILNYMFPLVAKPDVLASLTHEYALTRAELIKYHMSDKDIIYSTLGISIERMRFFKETELRMLSLDVKLESIRGFNASMHDLVLLSAGYELDDLKQMTNYERIFATNTAFDYTPDMDNVNISHIIYFEEGLLTPDMLEINSLEVLCKILNLPLEYAHSTWFTNLHAYMLYNKEVASENIIGKQLGEIIAKYKFPKLLDNVDLSGLGWMHINALLKHPQYVEQVRSFSLWQLFASHHDINIEYILSNNFDEDKVLLCSAINALKNFPEFYSEDEQELYAALDIPDQLRQAEWFSWQHAFAYVREISPEILQTVTPAQAIGLAVGWSLELTQQDWYTSKHALVAFSCNEQEESLYPKQLAGLDINQLNGILLGFRLQAVQAPWFSEQHVVAVTYTGHHQHFDKKSAEYVAKYLANLKENCNVQVPRYLPNPTM